MNDWEDKGYEDLLIQFAIIYPAVIGLVATVFMLA